MSTNDIKIYKHDGATGKHHHTQQEKEENLEGKPPETQLGALGGKAESPH